MVIPPENRELRNMNARLDREAGGDVLVEADVVGPDRVVRVRLAGLVRLHRDEGHAEHGRGERRLCGEVEAVWEENRLRLVGALPVEDALRVADELRQNERRRTAEWNIALALRYRDKRKRVREGKLSSCCSGRREAVRGIEPVPAAAARTRPGPYPAACGPPPATPPL